MCYQVMQFIVTYCSFLIHLFYYSSQLDYGNHFKMYKYFSIVAAF